MKTPEEKSQKDSRAASTYLERRREQRRRRYAANRDRDIERAMRWKAANPEKARAHMRRFYQVHRDRRLAQLSLLYHGRLASKKLAVLKDIIADMNKMKELNYE